MKNEKMTVNDPWSSETFNWPTFDGLKILLWFDSILCPEIVILETILTFEIKSSVIINNKCERTCWWFEVFPLAMSKFMK